VSKLLARKRPRLLPIYDDVVKKQVGNPANIWESLRVALQADEGDLATRLRKIGDDAGGSHLPVLRVFDVVTWMEATTG
jgi:Family of unknown function (DUF6308)